MINRTGLVGFAAAVALTVAASSGAYAVTAGTLIGVFPGNDPFPSDFMGSPALYKCDEATAGTCTDEEGSLAPGEIYADAFHITFDTFNMEMPSEAIGGTWSFVPTGDETHTPAILVLKAGPDYAAYDISTLTLAGPNAWDTGDLSDKGISHISFYNRTGGGGGGGPPPPVSEPGILALAFSGITGALWLRRRAARS